MKKVQPDTRIEVERRVGQLEVAIAGHEALLMRNTEILDDIRTYINTPRRYPEWIAACVGVLLLSGSLLYMAYIAPLEERIADLKIIAYENKITIGSTSEYVKESRRLWEEWLRNNRLTTQP